MREFLFMGYTLKVALKVILKTKYPSYAEST